MTTQRDQAGNSEAAKTTKVRVLDAIVRSVKDHGHPPTIRQLCEETGLKSTSSVVHHLRMLEMGGYIRRGGGRNQWIIVLNPGGDQ